MDGKRAEAFSDGVFSIAATLLALELPRPEGHAIAAELLEAWPAYAAYVVSFITIGIMWLNHHSLLSHITRVSRPLLVLNLVLLMLIAAVPFPTAMVAEHLSREGGEIAAFSYGVLMIGIAISFSAIWTYVISHPTELDHRISPHLARKSVPRFAIGMLAYIVATIVALFSAPVALAIFGLTAVYYCFEHLPAVTRQSPASETTSQ